MNMPNETRDVLVERKKLRCGFLEVYPMCPKCGGEKIFLKVDLKIPIHTLSTDVENNEIFLSVFGSIDPVSAAQLEQGEKGIVCDKCGESWDHMEDFFEELSKIADAEGQA